MDKIVRRAGNKSGDWNERVARRRGRGRRRRSLGRWASGRPARVRAPRRPCVAALIETRMNKAKQQTTKSCQGLQLGYRVINAS
eukprot:6192294-Pleurochrysis_carterae.AAC.1